MSVARIQDHARFRAAQQEPSNKEGRRVVADCDDGYTRTANEIQLAKCKLRMAGRVHCVLDAVIYATYGWNKKEDRLTNTYLAELCGIDPSDINDALKHLAARKIINLKKFGQLKLVSVNKVVSEWDYELSDPVRAKKHTGDSAEKTGDFTQKNGRKQVSNRAEAPNTQDNLTQDKEQKISSSEIADAIPDNPSVGGDSSQVVKPEAAVQTPSGKHWGTQGDLTCAEYIYAKVLLVNPTARAPNWPKWANDIRLLREQDKRTHREICELFKCANSDGFWRVNVLSPATLRDKWDSLQAKRLNAGVIPQSNATFDLAEHMTTERLNAMLKEGF